MTNTESQTEKSELKTGITIIGGLLAVMWGVESIEWVLSTDWGRTYGILPRNPDGLWGLLLSPLLHGGFGHLIANSIPFAILGGLMMLRGVNEFVKATIQITILGGLCVWLIGASNSYHIGASGVIFGYMGFLLSIGIFERSIKGIAIALVAGFFYGGILWGVLPSEPGISWEGHLFGFLAGIASAKFLAKKKE